MNPPTRARRAPSLLNALQSLLERTYRMNTGISDVGRFVIGDEGYRVLYDGEASGAGRSAEESGAADLLRAGSAGSGARVLLRTEGGAISARIYYPDSLIRTLEESPPSRGVGDENIDAFAAFIEELDHLLLVAERARLDRPVSLLELEMHANVTKYLVCGHYLAAGRAVSSRRRLPAEARVWLLWHLFEKHDFAEPDPAVQARYQDASRFARRFLEILDRDTDTASRLSRLRAFHDATHHQKLAALA